MGDDVAQAAQPAAKLASVFYPSRIVMIARQNAAQHAWAASLRDIAVKAAEPWMEKSDDELWGLMFGATISRSWMVWSNGHCPACKQSVPMYNWKINAMARPWKVWCPHCSETFPKNDFHAFYLSGLDEHGVFDPAGADRSLLFNIEHPQAGDPLRNFGVDEGKGYGDGDNCWRFIGAYLIYGQWKQAILGGINNLAAAYVLTGDRRYAHKSGVMLDRVADLYPTFDFKTQAILYEGPGSSGYVSTWHDACEETRELALAYDMIFDGIKHDVDLPAFLSQKARQYGTENPKTSFAEVQRNIETGILRDALANRHKIQSNYPRTPIAVAVIEAILDWPGNSEIVLGIIDEFLQKATAVDGVTGEKGLANYSAFGVQSTALFLAEWDRAIPGFLEQVYTRQPRLHDMFRFHIDTWCLKEYYPLVGDTGWFAGKINQYQGVRFPSHGDLAQVFHGYTPLKPSMYTFLWRLHQLTGDAAFAQALYLANNGRVEGLPYDLFIEEPEPVRSGVAAVIKREGSYPGVGSVNKKQWGLAILRSGEGGNARAAWLNYSVEGNHRHADGMNLGLFAYGLDLMPDFGYPPVQFGGWDSPKALWYRMTAAHNTVVVDGKNQLPVAGRTTLWVDGQILKCVRASAPAMIGDCQYERTVATVSLPKGGFYLMDVFRVVGGWDHTMFFHSHFGKIQTKGLDLENAEPYGHNTEMRDFRIDRAPKPGWYVDWSVEDRYGILPEGTSVGVRYTALTDCAQAGTAEAWISYGGYGGDITQQAWIPRIMMRRQARNGPLASTFVAIIEPFQDQANVRDIRRVSVATVDGQLYEENTVALEVTHADGTQDLLLAADVENPQSRTPTWQEGGILHQPDWDVRVSGQFALVRRDPRGKLLHVAEAAASSELHIPLNIAVTSPGGGAI